MRGYHQRSSVYEACYNMCVTSIKNNNNIHVIVAGFGVCAMLDTGSSISVISNKILNKLNTLTDIKVQCGDKQCILADGSTVNLDKTVVAPVKLDKVTFMANLYVLDTNHIDMIIGCDLLNMLCATIDYKRKRLTVNSPINHTSSGLNMESLGTLSSEFCTVKHYTDNADPGHMQVHTKVKRDICDDNSVVQLTTRVEKINIAESDTNSTQKQELIKLVNAYQDAFANNLMELGRTNIMEYDIEIEPHTVPICSKAYSCPYKFRQIILDELQQLREADLIQPAGTSRWGSPTVLVSKPRSNKMRLCCDMRKINEKTVLQAYPMLNMNVLFADIGKSNSQYFTIIDLSNSYRQIPLTKRSQEIATMVTIAGSFKPTTCTFGMKNIPFIFTRLMDTLFGDIKGEYMNYFQDDIIIFSKSFDDHLAHIEEVLTRLRASGLTAKPEKTFLCKRSVQYLGFILDKSGVSTTEENIAKVKHFPRPTSQKLVRGYLGLTSFYRRHIRGFSQIAAPLYALTAKMKGKFVWTQEAETAFQTLKEKLISAPLLAYPNLDSGEKLRITVDASSSGLAYILSQMQLSNVTNKLIERPICYGSTILKGNEKHMCSTDLELAAVCFSLKQLDCWVRGTKFILITDHKSLTYMMNKSMELMKPATARKLIFLQQYDFELQHRKGELIRHVDTLSRQLTVHGGNADIEPVINAIKHTTAHGIPSDNCDLGLTDLSIDNVRAGQRTDHFYTRMYDYLQYGKLPEQRCLSRKIQKQQCNYIVDNNLLYHVWLDKNRKERYKQLCIPAEYREKVLAVLHDIKTTGHRGAAKMYWESQRKVYWSDMYKDIQNYVASCKLCMESNTGHAPKVQLCPIPAETLPFRRVHVDLLKFKVPSRGYNYVLALIDSFSKYLVTKSLKRKTALSVVKSIYTEWILRYGIPKELTIVTDNGAELKNSYSKVLYQLLGIRTVYISTYHAAANSQVERANRSIISFLRKFCKDDPKSWATNLPYATFVINSSVSETTKCSAFSLMHGIEPLGILDLCLPATPDDIPTNMQQAHKYWSSNLTMLRKLAIDNIAMAQAIQKKNYDAHARPHNFSLADKVYVKLHRTEEHDDAKLRQQYKGIFKITKFISPTNVILEDENGKQLPRSVHINFLKKYRDRNVYNVDDDSDTDSDDTVIYDLEDIRDADQPLVNSDHLLDCADDKTEPDNGAVSTTTRTDNLQQLPFSQLEETSFYDATGANQPSTSIPTGNKTTSEYHQINKVYRQRTLPSGEQQYFVSWHGYPAKKHRCWIDRQALTPDLQKYVDNRKLPCKKGKINAISTTPQPQLKIITDNNDWLSWKYIFSAPINLYYFTSANEHNSYHAKSMHDVYLFMMNYLFCGGSVISENGLRNENVFEQQYSNNWQYFKPMLMCFAIKRVINSNADIASKLLNSSGLYIVENDGSVSLFTLLLMCVRENIATASSNKVSVNLSSYGNPIPHVYSSVIGSTPLSCLYRSCLDGIPYCVPSLKCVNVSDIENQFLKNICDYNDMLQLC